MPSLGYRSAVLRARLFGALSAEVEGRAVPPIPGFKARSLFAYLLVNRGPHPRVRLAGTFWPDVSDTRARASLRVALFGIRQALDSVGGAAYLAADRLTAGLSADLPMDVDVERFERLFALGDPASLADAVAAELGVAPSAALQEVARRLRSVDEAPEPPSRPVAAVPAGPLLGRETEVATLRGWWRSAVAGGPLRFGLVTGEGGIGKTRLAAELTAFAVGEGARVATGSGLELAGAPPFAPWSEILRELVRQTPAPAGTAEWPDVLARLTPAVTRYWGPAACPPSPPPELERARRFHAVGELIAGSAPDRAVLPA